MVLKNQQTINQLRSSPPKKQAAIIADIRKAAIIPDTRKPRKIKSANIPEIW